jgi:hypothetical protein
MHPVVEVVELRRNPSRLSSGPGGWQHSHIGVSNGLGCRGVARVVGGSRPPSRLSRWSLTTPVFVDSRLWGCRGDWGVWAERLSEGIGVSGASGGLPPDLHGLNAIHQETIVDTFSLFLGRLAWMFLRQAGSPIRHIMPPMDKRFPS